MSDRSLVTDYLIVGAGAAGMAFADELMAHSDADVVMVDRRHRPGGHWNDAYPFVRLHQPSAFYGVNSRMLGSNSIDEAGSNAGFYERATAAEILDYYDRVLVDHLLPSGRVHFYGMSDYVGGVSGEHRFVSRLTGEATNVRVRRKIVDATYLETPVPSTHVPSFEVEPGARMIPVNDLVGLEEPGDGYTLIGSGKTAMDACLWLLDNGVPPASIRWIRPRDAWMLARAFAQPLELVSWLIEGVSLALESAAEAERAPGRPIFDGNRITLQQVRTCQPTFNAALVAFVESCRGDDAERNRLCPPNPYPDSATDWIAATRVSTRAESIWLAEPDLAAWMERSRLNAARGISDHLAEPKTQAALGRFVANTEPAIAKLGQLLAQARPGAVRVAESA